MLSPSLVPLHKKVLNPLVSDYLAGKKEISGFYDFFPDREGFSASIKASNFKTIDRGILSGELISQAQQVANTSKQTLSNIELLKNERTFTVTTGHQLCLFTGPLYFIYKIFSAINLSEKLKQEFPTYNFVPVYWMAGEDHDFAEVNHLNVFGKKVEWNSDQTGAVGNFSTRGLDEILAQLKLIWGDSEESENLSGLFKEAYLDHADLASATRYLVNSLFGEYGLVVADGNSGILKNSFIPFLKKDIFNNIPFRSVSSSISKLVDLGYDVQVNPREINCFYLDKSLRARIEKVGDKYFIHGTEKVFSESELANLIETEPERISANVVLRPCYQQAILPNIAYVGGPGELAYWLEYKHMFDELGLFFPVLVPRNFVTIIDKATQQKMTKLGLDEESIFNDEQELIKDFLEKSHNTIDLNNFKTELGETFGKIGVEAIKTDPTLRSTVEAELQKSLNSVDHIEQKMNRAIKHRSDTEINQIRAVKSKLFPGSVPQERFDNFSMYYLKWGKQFLMELKKNIRYDLTEIKSLILKEQ